MPATRIPLDAPMNLYIEGNFYQGVDCIDVPDLGEVSVMCVLSIGADSDIGTGGVITMNALIPGHLLTEEQQSEIQQLLAQQAIAALPQHYFDVPAESQGAQ
jgi:hypothetical protein